MSGILLAWGVRSLPREGRGGRSLGPRGEGEEESRSFREEWEIALGILLETLKSLPQAKQKDFVRNSVCRISFSDPSVKMERKIALVFG